MKIYTKTGDDGTTGLFGGNRVSKDNTRIEAYGTVDELNSNIGYLKSTFRNAEFDAFLENIQSKLFTIGSQLATPDKSKLSVKPINNEDINRIEEEIDSLNTQIEPLRNFILPGGCASSAYCQIVRTVCRRAERRVVTLHQQTEVDYEIMHFLNRLSDYFFVLARVLNKQEGRDDVAWVPK